MSRKRLLKVLIIISVLYAVLQSAVIIYGDTDLSKRCWLENKNNLLDNSGKPLKSEYSFAVKIISDYNFWLLRAFIAAVVILIFYNRNRDIKKKMFYFCIFISSVLILIIVSAVITWTFKLAVGRPRPYTGLTEFISFSLSNKYHSFPSGHTTEVFSYIFPFLYFLRGYFLKILLVIYGLLIGLTRVLLAYHYISDVLFGMYITFFFGTLICYFIEKRFLFPDKLRHDPDC